MMNKSDLEAIEKIIIRLLELKIVTSNHDEKFFYDNLEMNILIDYIEEISSCLRLIGEPIKNKYPNVSWDAIDKERDYDEFLDVSSMNVGKACKLAYSIYDTLYDDLMMILSANIDDYNHELCEKRHNELKGD